MPNPNMLDRGQIQTQDAPAAPPPTTPPSLLDLKAPQPMATAMPFGAKPLSRIAPQVQLGPMATAMSAGPRLFTTAMNGVPSYGTGGR